MPKTAKSSINLEQLQKDLKVTAKKYSKETGFSESTITSAFFRRFSKYGDRWRNHFNTYNDFKKSIFQSAPNLDSRVERNSKNKEKFNRDSISKVIDDRHIFEKRRYFLTSAIPGQSANTEFLKTVLKYCDHKQAALVILGMRGVKKHGKYSLEEYPDELRKYSDYFVKEYMFNSNLKAWEANLLPQMINPLTGLDRFADEHSLIVASPKQHMRVVPGEQGNIPHTLHTTGVITNPDTYNLSDRQGRFALKDHIIGGLIVEVEDDKIFHIRQVQADSNNGFYDLAEYFCGNKVEKVTSEVLVMGDYHAGFHDDSAVNSWKEVVKYTKPKYILFHDLFDGYSISHHHEENTIVQISRPEHLNTLKKELDIMSKELKDWSESFPNSELIIVRSNHDEHVDRYLTKGKFLREDRFNAVLAFELYGYLSERKNPLEEYVNKYHGKLSNVRWLRRGEQLTIEGVKLGYHGDKGANGSRLGPELLKKFGDCVVGHSHSPLILGKAWRVGTTSLLQRDYNIGEASSWLHTSCLIYKWGLKTLINSIDGKWKI